MICHRKYACNICLVVLIGLAIACRWPRDAAAMNDIAPPRLVVLLVFDQLRGDYLDRWENLFAHGFNRVRREGVYYANCHYPYAFTVTGAGHAAIATGSDPAVNGIVGNEWYDRSAGKEVNCIGSERYTRVPPLNSANPINLVPGRTRKTARRPNGCWLPALQTP